MNDLLLAAILAGSPFIIPPGPGGTVSADLDLETNSCQIFLTNGANGDAAIGWDTDGDGDIDVGWYTSGSDLRLTIGNQNRWIWSAAGASTNYSNLLQRDNTEFYVGNASDGWMRWSTVGTHHFALGVNDGDGVGTDVDFMTVDTGTDDAKFSGGLRPGVFTADPCGTLPEGSFFYNDTANIPCYCDQAGADLKVSDNSACF